MSTENFRLPLARGGLAVAKLWPKESSLLAGHFRPQPAHRLACGSKYELSRCRWGALPILGLYNHPGWIKGILETPMDTRLQSDC